MHWWHVAGATLRCTRWRRVGVDEVWTVVQKMRRWQHPSASSSKLQECFSCKNKSPEGNFLNWGLYVDWVTCTRKIQNFCQEILISFVTHLMYNPHFVKSCSIHVNIFHSPDIELGFAPRTYFTSTMWRSWFVQTGRWSEGSLFKWLVGSKAATMCTDDFTHQLLRRQPSLDSHQGWRGIGCLWTIRCSCCLTGFNFTPWLHVPKAKGRTRMDMDRMVPAILDRWITSHSICLSHDFSIPPLSPFAEKVYNPLTNSFLTTGWSAVPEEKSNRYRLSIKDVQPHDSGTYTCASPRGLTNSIIIVVAGNP